MACAVEAFAERKFGPGGPFHPGTPGAWTDSPRVRGSAQIHDRAFTGLVRSLVLCSTWARSDAFLRAAVKFWRWLPEAAPSERAFLEAFYLWIYTPRAHEDGTVGKIIEDVLAFPYQPSTEAIQRSIDAFVAHDTAGRLAQIAAPTLVLAGELDMITPPRYGRVVADGIPGARFEVLAGEAHQPFQEAPGLFNATVDSFWREVEARG